MESKRSFQADVVTSLVAFGTGSLAGLVVSWPVAVLTYVIAENGCSGESMCGLDATFWAVLAGLVLGVLAFAAGASRSLIKHCQTGERLRVGLLTFLGVPIFLVLLFSAAGLT